MNQHVLLALVLSYLWCLPGLYAVVRCKLLCLLQESLREGRPLVCVTPEATVGCHSGLFGYEVWNKEIFLIKGWHWKFLAKMRDSSSPCLLTSLNLGDRAGGQGVKTWKWRASTPSKCSVWVWKQYVCLEPLSSWKKRSGGVSFLPKQWVRIAMGRTSATGKLGQEEQGKPDLVCGTRAFGTTEVVRRHGS